jgi:hypothetical protein
MLQWLATACKDARAEGDVHQVRVAAAADPPVDQSVIARFEKGQSWPRDLDAIVAGYADELEVSELELWERALELWRTAGRPEEESGVSEGDPAQAALDEAAAAVDEAGRRSSEDERRSTG